MIFLELLMSEGMTLISRFYFMETVHVELADEWRKIVMFEVAREDTLGELVWLFHHKAVSWITPTNYMVQAGVLQKII